MQPAHVLVVEDNAAVSSAMRILFESAGHRVSVAASIAEALSVGDDGSRAISCCSISPCPMATDSRLVEPLRAAGCKTIVALTGHDDCGNARAVPRRRMRRRVREAGSGARARCAKCKVAVILMRAYVAFATRVASASGRPRDASTI